MKRSGILKIAIAVLAILPVVTLAQVGPIQVPDVGLPGASNSQLGPLITDFITGIFLPLAGIVAVLFLIIGGFQYMMAGANEGLAKRGRDTIRYAIIGLVIIILSYVIITVVVNTLTCNTAYC
jgi:cytochrome bd-type quinol oxidase subunit 2